MAFDIDKSQQEREQLLKQQFGAARRRIGGQRMETERQSRRGFERLAATTGQTGGAIEKARQKATSEIGKAFGDVEAGLAGQEAGALQQLKGEGAQMGFARSEREGSQAFAAQEAEKQRQLQREQFKETLGFQKDSFAQQMAFTWAEFDENKKTNFFNAMTALEDSGIDSQKDLMKMFNFLNQITAGKPYAVGSKGNIYSQLFDANIPR